MQSEFVIGGVAWEIEPDLTKRMYRDNTLVESWRWTGEEYIPMGDGGSVIIRPHNGD